MSKPFDATTKAASGRLSRPGSPISVLIRTGQSGSSIPAKAATIMEATLVLAGLRLENDEIKSLRGRLHTMNITTESSYYRIAVEEGMEKKA